MPIFFSDPREGLLSEDFCCASADQYPFRKQDHFHQGDDQEAVNTPRETGDEDPEGGTTTAAGSGRYYYQ